MNLILKFSLSVFASCFCFLVNNSKLPGKIAYNSKARLSSIKFDSSDIYKIIRSSNVNKTHEHDGIWERIIKMCNKSLVQPLTLIFTGWVDTGVSPGTSQKSKKVPVHKKGDKQIVTDQFLFYQYAWK